MTARPRGRAFQDATFEVAELRGRTLERLLGATSRPAGIVLEVSSGEIELRRGDPDDPECSSELRFRRR